MQDGNPGVPAQQQPKTYDYFNLKMQGIPDDKVYHGLQPGDNVSILPPGKAWEKYGQQGIKEGKWKDQQSFDKAYADVNNSYSIFKKSQHVLDGADKTTASTKSGANDVSSVFTPYRVPVENVGMGKMKGAEGTVRLGTRQQVAYDRGYAIDDSTGKKIKSDDLGYFDKIYVTSDKDGNPELHKGNMFQDLRNEEAVSWMGPSHMSTDWGSKFIGAMSNAIADIPGQVGSLIKMSSDIGTGFANWMDHGKFESDPNTFGNKIANVLKNVSGGLEYKHEDEEDSFMYNTVNTIAGLVLLSKVSKVAGLTTKTLGLSEEAAIRVANSTAATGGAAMVTDGFLQQSKEAGIPDAHAAVMALGVFGASHFLLGKFGPNAAFKYYEKYVAEGSLKQSIQEGLDKEMEAMTEKDVNKITPDGRKRILGYVLDKMAKGMEYLNKGKSFGANVLEGSVKGGADFGAFQLLQNSIETVYDEIQKKRNPEAEQGAGLYFSRSSRFANNIWNGVGSSILTGALSSGLFGGAESLLHGKMMSEQKARYMEKEIAEGRYDNLVNTIKTEGEKGTWGMRGVDKDGNAIGAGEDKEDLNSFNTKRLLDQASMLKEFYDRSGVSDPKFLQEKLGGDKGLQIEALRNIRQQKELELNIQHENKSVEEAKKAGSTVPDVSGKIADYQRKMDILKNELQDITSGKRADEKVTNEMANLHYAKTDYKPFNTLDKNGPITYKGINEITKGLKEAEAQEKLRIEEENKKRAESRTGVKEFAGTLTGKLDEELLSKIAENVSAIQKHGTSDKATIEKMGRYIEEQINAIKPFDYETEELTDARKKEVETREKLEEYKQALAGDVSEKPVTFDKEKFQVEAMFNKNNISGLDTNEFIKKLYSAATEGSSDEKLSLADIPKDVIDKLKDDNNFAVRKADALSHIVPKLEAKHTGMDPNEAMTEKQFEDVQAQALDNDRMLKYVEETSKTAANDKKLIQKKVRYKKSLMNYHILKGMEAFVKGDESIRQEMASIENRFSDQDKLKVSPGSKELNYNEDILSNIEKHMAVVESYMHDKLAKDKNHSLRKKMLESMLKGHEAVGYGFAMSNVSRYVDLVNDEYLKKGNDNLEGKEASLKVASVINYLNRVSNLDSVDFYKALEAYVKEKEGNTPSYEQTECKDIVAFLQNNHNEVINEWNDIRRKKYGKDIMDSHIDNAISIQGYARTGKTSMLLPTAIEVYKRLNPGAGGNNKVLFVAPSSGNMDALKKAMNPVCDLRGEGSHQVMGTEEFIKNMNDENYKMNDFHFVVVDEASMLGNDDVSKINEKFKKDNPNAKALFVLDQYQGAKEEQINRLKIIESTLGTFPLTVNYTTGNLDVLNLSDALRNYVDNQKEINVLPSVSHNDERTEGAEYFRSKDEMVGAFISEYNKAVDSKNTIAVPWLIVGSEKNRSAMLEELSRKKDIRDIGSIEKYIKTISGDDKSNTAQGLENPRVFIYLNPEEYKATSTPLNNHYARFLYTAVTRVGGNEDMGSYAGIYTPIKEAKNISAKPIRAKGVPVDKPELLKRLQIVNSNEKAVTKKEEKGSSFKPKDVVQKKNGENFNSRATGSFKDAIVEKVNADGTIVTTHGEQIKPEDIELVSKKSGPDNIIPADYVPTPVHEYKPEHVEQPGEQGRFVASAKVFSDKGDIRINTAKIDKEILSPVIKDYLAGRKPELTIKKGEDRGEFKNVFEIYDKGKLVGTTHIVEVGFDSKTNHEFNNGIDYSEEGVKKARAIIANSFGSEKDPAKRQALRDLNIARLNANLQAVKGEGLPVTVDYVNPGKLKLRQGSEMGSFKDLKDTYEKKGYIFGNVNQSYSDINGKTYPGLQVEVYPSQEWKDNGGKPMSMFVRTPRLNEEEISRIVDNIDADHVLFYDDAGQEAIRTIDYNQSILKKALAGDIQNTGAGKFLIATDKGVTPIGDMPVEKATNLKDFYKFLNSKDGKGLRDEMHLWVGIDHNSTFRDQGIFDLKGDNLDKLETKVQDILPPELYYKHEAGGISAADKILGVHTDEREQAEVNPDIEFSVEQSMQPSPEEQAKEETEKESEYDKDYISLAHVFNNMALVNSIEKMIRRRLAVDSPGQIVSPNGTSIEHKDIQGKIDSYKQDLKNYLDQHPLDNTITSDNLLTVDDDKYKSYRAHYLLDDTVFNKFLKHIFPEIGKENLRKREENTQYDINSNVSHRLKNALASIEMNKYSVDDNGVVRNKVATGGYVGSVWEKIVRAGAMSEKENTPGKSRKDRFVDILKSMALAGKGGDGYLTNEGNAIYSFVDKFYGQSDIGKPESFSYEFLQENKKAITDFYPNLKNTEDFSKHHEDIAGMMNNLYSVALSNTRNNYAVLENGKRGLQYVSRSSETSDEVKTRLKDASDSFLSRGGASKKSFKNITFTHEGNIMNIGREGRDIIQVDMSDKGKFGFGLDPRVTMDDVRHLFSSIGLHLSPDAIKVFWNNEKGKGDYQYNKNRLARIAGTFLISVKAGADESFHVEHEQGLKEIFSGQGAEMESERLRPSDFRKFMENIAKVESAVREDAHQKRTYDANNKRVNNIVPGSYTTRRLSDGGQAIRNEYNSMPEEIKALAKNRLNQVKNGKLSWSKIELYNGIRNEFGKSKKYGKDVTEVDFMNMAMEPFLKDIGSGKEYGEYHIIGSPGGDSSTIRMFPLRVSDTRQLFDANGLTREGEKYITQSIVDEFNKHKEEYIASKEKWKPYLQGKMDDATWAGITPDELEGLLNGMSARQKMKLAATIENDNNFIKNKDVRIKYKHEIDPGSGISVQMLESIKLGHATTFNKDIDRMYNGEQFAQMRTKITQGLSTEEAVKQFYTPFIQENIQALRNKGYKMSSDKVLGDYILFRDIALRNIDPNVYGDKSQYKDADSYQKYAKESPGIVGKVGGDGMPAIVNSATIPDVDGVVDNLMNSISDKAETVNLTDGVQIVHPFYAPIVDNAFSGFLGKGAWKFRTKFVGNDGIAVDIKSATMQIKPEMLDNSSVVGYEWIKNKNTPLENLLRLMTSNELYQKFNAVRSQYGTEEAYRQMTNLLKENPEYHNHIIHFAQHSSAMKVGERSSNRGVSEFEGMQKFGIQSDHMLHQLNTDESPDENEGLASKQLISNISILPQNKEYVKTINEAQLEIAKKNFDSIVNQVWRGVDKGNKEEVRRRFLEYIKDLAYIKSASMDTGTVLLQALSNPHISLNISSLGDMAKRVFIKELNKGIKFDVPGSGNVKQDAHYFRQTMGKDGNKYTLADIKKMGPENARKLGLDTAPDEEYKDARYVDKDGNEIMDASEMGKAVAYVPAETIGTYKYTKQFGLRPDEDINQIYSIAFKDGSFINTRSLSEEERHKLLLDMWSKDAFDNVDVDKSPMLREGMPAEVTETMDPKRVIAEAMGMGEKEAKKASAKDILKAVQYIKRFEKTLYGLSVRTPATGMESATPTKLTSILNSYGSVEFSNGKRNLRDGADYDIDKYTNYNFTPSTKPSAEDNLLMGQLNAYADPKNAELIYRSVDPKKYQRTDVSGSTMLARSVDEYKKSTDGKNVIGMVAIANKSYNFLYQSLTPGKSFVSGLEIRPDGKDAYGKLASTNFVTLMHAAVDNAKLSVLGPNGVDMESVKVLNAILLSAGKPGYDDKIKEGFDFLTKPVIKTVFDKYWEGKSVKGNNANLPDLITEAEKNVTAAIKTPEELVAAQPILDDLKALRTYHMLGEGFSRLNAIFKIDSKAIESNDYDRTREMEGPYGLEAVLNAPADVIFGDPKKYEQFQKDNPEWYMGKSTLPYTKEEYAKVLEREKWIRKHFDYKGILDALPQIKEYWRQHHEADTYFNDNFVHGNFYRQAEEKILQSLGNNDWFNSDQFTGARKEFDKWLTGLYYNMEHQDKQVQSYGREDSEGNRYSLATVEGRNRYNYEVTEWLSDILAKGSEFVRRNSALNELVISSRKGGKNISLKYGNRYPDEKVVQMQKDMLKLKDVPSTSFSTEGNKLSVYDVLQNYSTINDNFFTGGNSIAMLFGKEGMINYSSWMENKIVPSIENGEKLSVYDKQGNLVLKPMSELIKNFIAEMPVKGEENLRQRDSRKNRAKWGQDPSTKPEFFNSKEGFGKQSIDVVKDKQDRTVYYADEESKGYDPISVIVEEGKPLEEVQLVDKDTLDTVDRLQPGESFMYSGPKDVAIKTGMVKIGEKDIMVTKTTRGYEFKNPEKQSDILRSVDEGIQTPKDAQKAIMMNSLPGEEGKSDLEKYLGRVADPSNFNNTNHRDLADYFLKFKDKLPKDLKINFFDRNSDKTAKDLESRTGQLANGYFRYSDNSIHIAEQAEDMDRALLHETVHALTSNTLKGNNISEHDNAFRDQINGLYRYAKEKMQGESFHGLTNVHEFVAEAFSDKNFQKRLMQITSPEKEKSILGKFFDHVADYFSKVFGFDRDIKGTLLNDILSATHSFLSGETVTGTKGSEGVLYSATEKHEDNIDAAAYRITGKMPSEHNNPDLIREKMFRRPADQDNVYYLNDNKNEPIFIPANSSPDFIDDKIREIQNLQADFSDELKERFINGLNNGGTSESVNDAMGKRKDGSDWYTSDVMNNFHKVVDLDVENGDKVMRLSQLSAQHPEIRMPEGFKGNDPLVIVHNTSFSDMVQKDIDHKPVTEVSLIDVTRRNLMPGGENLFSKYKKGGATNLTKSERGVRNFQLALTAMKMRELNENIRFRKIGVMQMVKDNIHYSFDAHMDPDMRGGFLSEFKKFLVTNEGKTFMKSMPEDIQSMLKDPEKNPLLNKSYGADYLWMLKTEYDKALGKTGLEISDLDRSNKKDAVQSIYDFMNTRENGYKTLAILRERQRVMELVPKAEQDKAYHKELNMLDQAIYELNQSSYTKYDTVKDITVATGWLSTESNIDHPLAQYALNEKNRANRFIAKSSLDFMQGLKPAIEKVKAIMPYIDWESKIKDQGSKIFEQCMKKRDAIEQEKDDKGLVTSEKRIRMNSKMLHTDLNDPETREAIAKGETTKEHVEFGKLAADHIWDIYHDIIRHEFERSNNGQFDLSTDAGKAKLERMVDERVKAQWTYGMLPTMTKSLGEKWFGFDFTKLKQRILHPNVDLPDLLGNKEGTVSNYFANQMGTHEGLGNADVSSKLLGISVNPKGEWVLENRKAYEDVSYDMEQILTALKMHTLRKEKFDNEVIPAYNNARRIVDQMILQGGIDGQWKNLKKFINESYMAGVEQGSHVTDPNTLLGKVESVSALTRTFGSSAATAFNLGMTATIALTNPMISFVKSVAHTVGDSHLFHTSDLVKAMPKLMSEKKLLNGIGDMYGVANMSAKNVTSDPNKSTLKKSFFKSFWMHWPVYAVDYATREWLMAAQMMRDGKFDAHSYNEKTGKVEYDEKKDRQFWNEDGTQTPAQKLMRQKCKEGLIRDGWMKEEDTRLPKGYSVDTGEKGLKDISDQVVYNMGNDGHTNIQNFELGRQAHMFKSFVFGQIEQAWSRPYDRIASGKMVMVKDEYGNDVAKFQPEDYEGMARSFTYAMKQLVAVKGNPVEWWSSLDAKQRKNMAALVGDVMLFSGLMMIFNANKPEDKKKYKFGNRQVQGSRLNESIKASAFDLVNPFFPNFWVGSVSKGLLPSVDFAVQSGKMAWNLANLDFRKALESSPIARTDVKIAEQALGVNAPKHKRKTVTQ